MWITCDFIACESHVILAHVNRMWITCDFSAGESHVISPHVNHMWFSCEIGTNITCVSHVNHKWITCDNITCESHVIMVPILHDVIHMFLDMWFFRKGWEVSSFVQIEILGLHFKSSAHRRMEYFIKIKYARYGSSQCNLILRNRIFSLRFAPCFNFLPLAHFGRKIMRILLIAGMLLKLIDVPAK